jgi:hypothetical protein
MDRRTLAAVSLAALLLVAGCSAGSPSASTTESQSSNGSTIRVAGSGSAEAEPNQAIVRVAVVETADDAVTARERLAANSSRMRNALTEIGVDRDQITTRRYDIYQDLRRPREEGEEPRVQYRAVHSFEITLSDIDEVGPVIDTAVENGATEIEDIQFTLTTERRRQLERNARTAAMSDAREKARGLAESANLTITGVKVVRTTASGGPRPYESGATATETPAPTAAPDTDLESGPVTVVTSVEVVYKAAPADESTDESG